ncbi:MAG: iron-sulfur cluster repair di-iron protein [Parachlamydiaceae bacterium]
MKFLQENASIGSLVTKNPETAAVFEKLGLDYCCKGNKTLKEACDEKNLNMVEVLEALDCLGKPDTSMNWDRMSAKEIVGHIVNTYHTYAKEELQRISQLLVKLNTKHGKKYSYLSELQSVFEQMKDSLSDHMDEEEQLVFPLIVNLETDRTSCQMEVKKHLQELDSDHLETGAALERIKELTHAYTPPEGACTTHIVMLNSLERLEQNLHEHIHKENQILFPRAKSLL